MTDLEKIAYAKGFIDKLANGINPLDDTLVPDGELLNNVRLSRCFFFVSDILRQVIENGGIGTVRRPKTEKAELTLSAEDKSKLRVSEFPVTVSQITNSVNAVIDQEKMQKLPVTAINLWLVDRGYMTVIPDKNGKSKKLPTEQGLGIGILTEERSGSFGSYIAVSFSSEAQRFIYTNIDAIIEFSNRSRDKGTEEPTAKETEWKSDDDAILINRFYSGANLHTVAEELGYSESTVRDRLLKLKLIRNDDDIS